MLRAARGVLAAALVSFCCGQTSGPATGPAAVDLKDPAAAGRLAAELGDKDPAVREKGQGELDAIPVRSVEQLRKLAGSTSGAEARARLLGRLDVLDDVHALNPEMISMHLKDAPLSRVAEELSRQTGTTISGAAGSETFALDAEGVPFCEIAQRLGAQHLRLDVDANANLVLRRIQGDTGSVVFDRGAMVGVSQATLTPGGAGNFLGIPMMVVGDPRAPLVMVHVAGLKVAPETTGARLEERTGGLLSVDASAGRAQWTQTLVLENGNQEVGKRIRVSGVMELTVALETQTVELELPKQLQRKVACGENFVNVWEVSTAPLGQGKRMMTIAYQVGGSDGILPPPQVGDGATTEPLALADPGAVVAPAVRVAVVDAKGAEIYGQRVPPNSAMRARMSVQAVFTEPLKVVLTSPTKTRVVKVPFDFRNVAVRW